MHASTANVLDKNTNTTMISGGAPNAYIGHASKLSRLLLLVVVAILMLFGVPPGAHAQEHRKLPVKISKGPKHAKEPTRFSPLEVEVCINNPSPKANEYFGTSVAISNDGSRLLIGAYRDNTNATNAGSAYLYNSKGDLLQTINNPSPEVNDLFGFSVAISNDASRLLIGAHQDNTNVTNAGSAYLYNSKGDLLQTINNPSPEANEYFGRSVAISNDGSRLLIGAYGDITNATGAGSAYLYNSKGDLLQTINNPSPEVNDFFGFSVAISNDGSRARLLIGAFGDNTNVR
eukprot:scaffold94496_cov24-Attheya_sp.AAC.1